MGWTRGAGPMRLFELAWELVHDEEDCTLPSSPMRSTLTVRRRVRRFRVNGAL